MKKIIFVVLGTFFIVFCSAYAYAQKVSLDLSENVFRLHIIANSDNMYDQEIKLAVRNEILTFMQKQNINFNNIEETIKYYENNLENINNIINDYLKCNNINYSASSYITTSYFPAKTYDDITLPAGNYKCLKIELGENKGKNWWCILYPNLCVTDLSLTSESKEKLKNSLTHETYNLITANISYKFKIVEIFQNIKNK